MGNCLPGSPEIVVNRTSSFLLDLFNSTYEENYTDSGTDSNDEDFVAAEPCHNRYCPFFYRAAPPFLTATGATALVATAALLLALALRPNAWPRGRMLVAQLAVCCGLFAITLLPTAAGIAWGWRAGEGPCRAVLLLQHGSVLAQGLLLGAGGFGAWGRGGCVAVVLWVAAVVMAVPAALSGGTAGTGLSAQCVQRSVDVDSVVYLLHLTVCCCVLLLLPGALLMAAMLRGTRELTTPLLLPADLYRKVFVFREDPSDAYVLLQARPEHPMLNFTVCLRSYTDLTRPHSLFSYATKAQDNEILLFKPKPGEYRFYVGGKYVTFRVPENRGEWEHVCASWESGNGIAEFWLNGRPWPRKGLQKGYEVGNEAVVMLGQEQDAYGGGFDVYNSFTGEMADVHLWDAGLSPDKMRSAYLALRLPPALLAWGSLRYEAKGDVVVKPRLREALGA
ncbi:hypothetical protein CIB84_004882 [Bambusicola thoracicus]|uniref:C-reactive protein n=1 Tax=Bambusicola thoracicus TaxID=9083 RepID=A0A2P4T4U0_BAMTH|nr:hypothetical protein CIB84_004882 [Bambusicola thoracicus]